MFGTIPGDIIELNRFFIILVTIATELQGLEGVLLPILSAMIWSKVLACGYGYA